MQFKKKSKDCIKKFKKWFKDVVCSEDNPSFNIAEVTVVMIIAILFGIIVGCILTYGKGLAHDIDSQYARELVDTYETIVDNYYDSVTEEDLVNAAIDGMVQSLGDQYSYYMDSYETFDFNQRIDGSYVGIGATISYAETGNVVIEIFEDSPAEKAGLQIGDVILSVDDTDIVGYTLDQVSTLLIGDKGTKVKIKVQRGSEEKTLTLIRDTVVIPSVSSKLVEVEDENIGYISISTFAANTYSQFSEHLEALEEENINGLIIDVRDNLGGHLSQVDEILSLFFDNDTVLYQIESKNIIENVYSSSKETRKYAVVVLINSSSASASEILASSFQNSYENATIIGVQSYGKGTIQNAIQLSTGSSLKYTSQKWLTSTGIWLDGVGVTPDEIVEQEDGYCVVASEADTQFKRALEILGK